MAFLRMIAIFYLVLTMVLVVLLYTPATNYFGKLVVASLGGDHVLHVLVGAGLTLSSALLIFLHRYSARKQVLFWLVWLSLFVIDEYVQSFSYVRSSSIDDLVMSFLGWVIASSLWWLIWLLRQGKPQN